MAEVRLEGKKDDEGIKAILSHEIRNAIDYDQTELSDKRSRAIDYYFGDLKRDTPAAPNRSSIVSRDTSDVIGWMLPSFMRLFMASGSIVEYEPEGPEDEAFTDQASDYVGFIFMRENDGYRILYNATHDALLQKAGIVKQWWDDTPQTAISSHTGLNELQLADLVNDDDVEVLTSDERTEKYVDSETGEEQEMPVYDVKIERTKSYGCLRYEVVEPENFLMHKDGIYLSGPDRTRFQCHRQVKTRSQLIEMGFEKKKVLTLPGDRESSFASEDMARNEDSVDFDDSYDESTVEIELFECYADIDVDGDGVAETIRAYYAGSHGSGELLEWEIWEDETPFDEIPCEPVPHRFDGQSVADSVMDLQQIKTVFLRQMADNMYAVNNPQKEVEQGSVLNPDALVNPKFGQPIWKKRGSPPIQAHDTAFIGDKALLGLQYVDEIIERRTGVSRASMSLDSEVLQNQTATAVNEQRDTRQSKVELIARNMAELGWRKVFRKSLKLIVKHQDRARVVRLRGEWVEMDPRYWNADMDCTVNVGLGTGSRDRDMMMLQGVLQNQFSLAQSFMDYGYPEGAIELLDKIIDVMTKIAESAGLKNAEDYYPEITEEQKQQLAQMASQPQEDPKIALEREKMQMEAEGKQQDMQLEVQKAQQTAALDKQKMDSEILLRREQMNAEMALKTEQLAAELQLKREQMAAELELKRQMGVMNADVKMRTSQVNVGGEPG